VKAGTIPPSMRDIAIRAAVAAIADDIAHKRPRGQPAQ
jgi:hypothetical protein